MTLELPKIGRASICWMPAWDVTCTTSSIKKFSIGKILQNSKLRKISKMKTISVSTPPVSLAGTVG